MAGGFTAVGACISAITKNQVIAFILSLLICMLVNLAGFPVVLDYFNGWLPHTITDTIASFSFITNFNSITKGIIELRSLVYFSSFIIFWLFANMVLIELKKAD
jgi:ABC-2 type transport system permease protein